MRGLERAGGGDSATGDGQPALASDALDIELNPLIGAEVLNEQLRTANAKQAVGGQFGFVSASASSIGMRRTFEFPQVIGYRGPLLRVERKNKGEYVLAGMAPVAGRLSTGPIGDPTKVIPTPAPAPGDDE